SVTSFVTSLSQGTVTTISAPLHPTNSRKLKEELAILLQKGFVRVIYKGAVQKIESLLEDAAVENRTAKAGDLLIVIDRVTVDGEEDTTNRIADSVQTAFFEGKGDCYVE